MRRGVAGSLEWVLSFRTSERWRSMSCGGSQPKQLRSVVPTHQRFTRCFKSWAQSYGESQSLLTNHHHQQMCKTNMELMLRFVPQTELTNRWNGPSLPWRGAEAQT
ncbi:MAG: hypothetical protein ACKER6_01315 [Candidatus Hodgkinia cicadicola]